MGEIKVTRPGSVGLRALDRLPRSEPSVEELSVVTEVTRPGSSGLDAARRLADGTQKLSRDIRPVADIGSFTEDRSDGERDVFADDDRGISDRPQSGKR